MRIDRVGEILERARGKRILVAGDLMLDEFLWGEVTRISPEAPVPVVRVTGESWYPGGAANVARNVHELGGRAGVLGLCGADEAGSRLTASLEQAGIDTSGCVRDPKRATIVKTRIVAKHQQVVRVDREPPGGADAIELDSTVDAIERLAPAADAVIFSDYAKGFLSQMVVDAVMRTTLRAGKIITVDPSPLNPIRWAGATAIKPNRAEALRAAGLHELSAAADMRAVGNRLLAEWRTRMILLTLGEEGMLLFEADRPVFHTPTRAREVFDVSGAGDTAVAAFTLALCAGAEPAEAADLANTASGIVVGKLGTATASPAEILAAYEGTE
jgi:D-beta-D-heptose 7-phosphate kinase/D-beta-D-heptose 1-phosphate adenosyltransferase